MRREAVAMIRSPQRHAAPWLLLLAALAAALLPLRAPLAQQLVSGDLVLHYSAVPMLSITPEVARRFGLTRSASRALLTVALRRPVAGALDEAVPATLRAAATNEAGQRQELRLREVREGTAIYYLAEARSVDRETLRFEIEAEVAGRERPITLRFSQAFFAPR